MAMTRTYVSTRCRNRYLFDFEMGSQGYQVRVMEGPSFPSAFLRPGETPPGCKGREEDFLIRWFDLTEIHDMQSAQVVAGGWAEMTDEFIQTGRWHLHYTTNDGLDQFEFSVAKQGDGMRVYILNQPAYGSRSDSFHSSHRLEDEEGVYICWTATIPTWEDAEDLATFWAERTQRYIRTGKDMAKN